jgi:Fe-S cluster assembly scaffold protein SufB
MGNIINKINHSPVSTYRWLDVNEFKLDRERFHDKWREVIRSFEKNCPVKIVREDIDKKSHILDSGVPMGEAFRNYVSQNVAQMEIITISESLDTPIIFESNLDNESLIERNKVVLGENVQATLIFVNRGIGTYMGIQEVIGLPGSKGKIIKINLLKEDSLDLSETIARAEENSQLEVMHINLGNEITVDNVNLELTKNSKGIIKALYMEGNRNQLDMNYVLTHSGEDSISQMDVKGVLDNEAAKVFRGTIDFKQGAKRAKGREKEEVMLLSPNVHNKAMPLILCHEDDVSGEHAASCGRIDEDKLFYLMSRGFSMQESKKMIIEGNFNPILDEIEDEKLVSEIREMIQRRLS